MSMIATRTVMSFAVSIAKPSCTTSWKPSCSHSSQPLITLLHLGRVCEPDRRYVRASVRVGERAVAAAPRCGARAAEAAAAAASAAVAWLLLSLADDEREKEERTRELLMFLQTEILLA